jgi:hypothetical protein
MTFPADRFRPAGDDGIPLAATVLVRRCRDTTAAIAPAAWRHAHQTAATISHYRRRGDPLPPRLPAQDLGL